MNTHYITVAVMDNITGKTYSRENGRIVKNASKNNGFGWGYTYSVPDGESFAAIIKGISSNPRAALILGWVRGTEDGQPYRIIPAKQYDELAAKLEIEQRKGLIEYNGGKFAARVKSLFHPSCWIGFDRDAVEGMPAELKPGCSFDEWFEMLCRIDPQLAGAERVLVPSSSSRVMSKSGAFAPKNVHLYVQVAEALDTERYGNSMLIHSFEMGLGFMRPVFNAERQVIGSRAWSIFDPTTFSHERFYFEGAPVIDAELAGELWVEESEPVVLKGERIRTRLVTTPDRKVLEGLKLDMEVGRNGSVRLVNTTDLTPDVRITVKDARGEVKIITMKEFVDGSVDRYRCQSVFRPDSSSWAGYLNKQDCEPFMFDIGTRMKYTYNDTGVEALFAAASTVPPPPPSDGKEMVVPPPPKNNSVPSIKVYESTLAAYAPEFSRSDLGNAQRMAAKYAGSVKWLSSAMSWYYYDGKKWNPMADEQALQLASLVAMDMVDHANELSDDDPFRNHARISCNISGLNNMLRMAKSIPEMSVREEDVDRHWWHFAVANGYIDLRLKESEDDLEGFKSPDNRFFHTLSSDVEYVAGADCPMFIDALDDIFSGDKGMVSYFQRLMGYTMMGNPVEEILPFHIGGGGNGKSLLMGIMAELFGSYYATVPKQALMSNAGNYSSGNEATPVLAALRGVRLVITTETNDGDRLDTAVIKSLSGSDRIVARMLYGKPFEYQPKFVTHIPTNHAPIIRDSGQGAWRRIIQIDYREDFTRNGKGDKAMKSKIVNSEMSGILNWLIEGCRQYQLVGLNTPERVNTVTKNYRESMDLLNEWIEDYCEVGEDYEVSTDILWLSYKLYQDKTGEKLINCMRVLAKLLKERGFLNVKHLKGQHGVRGFKGIRVKVAS